MFYQNTFVPELYKSDTQVVVDIGKAIAQQREHRLETYERSMESIKRLAAVRRKVNATEPIAMPLLEVFNEKVGIADGQRRLRALDDAGYTTVTIIVVPRGHDGVGKAEQIAIVKRKVGVDPN